MRKFIPLLVLFASPFLTAKAGVSLEKPFIFYINTQLLRPAERPHVVRLLKDEFFFEMVHVQAFELAPGGKKGKANRHGWGHSGFHDLEIINIGGEELTPTPPELQSEDLPGETEDDSERLDFASDDHTRGLSHEQRVRRRHRRRILGAVALSTHGTVSYGVTTEYLIGSLDTTENYYSAGGVQLPVLHVSSNQMVPEPGTAVLFLAGGLMVFGRRYRRASS
jgi:hypothetical protein